MFATGVKVPIPVEHTTDPEKKRGDLIGIDVRPNDKGKLAAFGRIKFSSPEHAAAHKSSDVSIYVEPSFKDGNGTVWKRPIRHVALTNYPVIPGLGSFQPIAASFEEGSLDMSPLMPLAQQLGIQNADQKDDAALTAEIVASFSSLVDKVKKLEGQGQQPQQPPQPGMPGQQPPGAPGMQPPPQQPKMQFSAPLLGLLRDSRVNKLNSMVGKNITKATRDQLVLQYCNDDALTLAFDKVSEGAGDPGFDSLITALSLNTIAVTNGEQSGQQTMSLSNPAKMAGADSPLVADAERRREEFAGI
jgi:hypothetical protein